MSIQEEKAKEEGTAQPNGGSKMVWEELLGLNSASARELGIKENRIHLLNFYVVMSLHS